jgi:hypothetical protein
VNRFRLTWSLASRNIERFSGPQKVGSSAAEGFCNTIPLRADTVRCSWHIADVAKGGRFGKSSKRRTPPAKISPTRCHGVPVSLFHWADSRNTFETKQRPGCQSNRSAFVQNVGTVPAEARLSSRWPSLLLMAGAIGSGPVGAAWHYVAHQAAPPLARCLAPGPERDRLIREARHCETGAQGLRWATSSNLQPPQR